MDNNLYSIQRPGEYYLPQNTSPPQQQYQQQPHYQTPPPQQPYNQTPPQQPNNQQPQQPRKQLPIPPPQKPIPPPPKQQQQSQPQEYITPTSPPQEPQYYQQQQSQPQEYIPPIPPPQQQPQYYQQSQQQSQEYIPPQPRQPTIKPLIKNGRPDKTSEYLETPLSTIAPLVPFSFFYFGKDPNNNLATKKVIRKGSFDHGKPTRDSMDDEFDSILAAGVNNEKDVKRIEELAKKKHSPSMAWCGLAFYTGEGLPKSMSKNKSKGKKLLKKASDKFDHPRASFILFQKYESKHLRTPSAEDPKKPNSYLDKSFNCNYEEALQTKVDYLFKSKYRIQYQELFQAFALYFNLSEFAGDIFIESYRQLGIHFYFGLGLSEEDKMEAYRYFYYAAVVKRDTKAFYYVGKCLYDGMGVEKNYNLAHYWFNQSNLSGDEKGTRALGYYFMFPHENVLIDIDYNKGRPFFDEAYRRWKSDMNKKSLEFADNCILHQKDPKEIECLVMAEKNRKLKEDSQTKSSFLVTKIVYKAPWSDGTDTTGINLGTGLFD